MARSYDRGKSGCHCLQPLLIANASDLMALVETTAEGLEFYKSALMLTFSITANKNSHSSLLKTFSVSREITTEGILFFPIMSKMSNKHQVLSAPYRDSLVWINDEEEDVCAKRLYNIL